MRDRYWEREGSFACGMAFDAIRRHGSFTGYRWRDDVQQQRAFPHNPFVQNAAEANRLVELHQFGLAMLCHDRPEPVARMAGAYGRPAGAFVQPHALHVMHQPRTER